MLHISIKAEPIFQFLNFVVTNSYLTSVIVLIIAISIAVYYKSQIDKKNKSFFFYIIHAAVSAIYDLFHGVVKDKINIFFPLIGALFFYILLQNWFGLLPGVGSILVRPQETTVVKQAQAAKHVSEPELVPLFRAGAADLNTTLALGLIAVFAIQYYGFKYLGFKGYIVKFINISNPINFLLGILEIISEISRVLSFAFRLFGNIFAGEVLIAVIAFLIPVLVTFPFFLMEIFVGLVQALVFSMLTAVLLETATIKHH